MVFDFHALLTSSVWLFKKKKRERETVRSFNEEGNWNWGRCALCYWRMDTSEPVARQDRYRSLCVLLKSDAACVLWDITHSLKKNEPWLMSDFQDNSQPLVWFIHCKIQSPLLTVFVFTCAKVNLRLLPPSRHQGPAGGGCQMDLGRFHHTLLEILSRGDSFKVSATILYLCLQLCLSLLLLLPLCTDCIRNPKRKVQLIPRAVFVLSLLSQSDSYGPKNIYIFFFLKFNFLYLTTAATLHDVSIIGFSWCLLTIIDACNSQSHK